MKIALSLEYNGTHFHGWQSQSSGRCVQTEVERAISTVAAHPVTVVCAGRTDAGVHALQQIIHFETSATRSMRSWAMGANSVLPHDISVHWACEMSDHFSARYSAIARTYQYVIYNYPMRPGVFHGQVSWYFYPLDITRMQAAADYLIGEHDFNAYRAQGCQSRSSVREVHSIDLKRVGHEIIVTIKANAFLYHMVRNIIGVLLQIGRGDQAPIWAKEVLESRRRVEAGVTASPYGLYLMQVDYPPEFTLPNPGHFTYHSRICGEAG